MGTVVLVPDTTGTGSVSSEVLNLGRLPSFCKDEADLFLDIFELVTPSMSASPNSSFGTALASEAGAASPVVSTAAAAAAAASAFYNTSAKRPPRSRTLAFFDFFFFFVIFGLPSGYT